MPGVVDKGEWEVGTYGHRLSFKYSGIRPWRSQHNANILKPLNLITYLIKIHYPSPSSNTRRYPSLITVFPKAPNQKQDNLIVT